MTDKIAGKTGRAARPMDDVSVERRAALEAWQKGLSDQVVTEIIRYRDLRKISNDELRRRLGVLGWDLTRDSLASVLGGKRKSMPISDVLLFAQALNVPPVALIFPIWSNQPTKLWPSGEADSYAIDDIGWFAGRYAENGGAWFAMRAPEASDERLETVHVDVGYFEVGDIMTRLGLLETLDAYVSKYNGALVKGGLSEADDARLRDRLATVLREIAALRGFLSTTYRDIKLPALDESLSFLAVRDFEMPEFPLRDFPIHPAFRPN